MKKFFDTYYAPNNAVLVVSGDTTPDEVMKLAEKHFGAHPVAAAAAAARHQGAAADGGEERSPRATSSRARRRSPSAITCRIG